MASRENNNQKRHGFLPMDTNLWDRFFIGVIVTFAIHLFWMRFLEAHVDLIGASLISIVVVVVVMARG